MKVHSYNTPWKNPAGHGWKLGIQPWPNRVTWMIPEHLKETKRDCDEAFPYANLGAGVFTYMTGWFMG